MKPSMSNSKKDDQAVDRSPANFDEKTLRIFAADILAPADFHSVYSNRVFSSEEELMAAVLEDGVADFQRYAGATERKGTKRFADVAAWIADDNSDWIFSFSNCCEVMGIEPNWLRQGLLRWQNRAEENLCRRSRRANFPVKPRNRGNPIGRSSGELRPQIAKYAAQSVRGMSQMKKYKNISRAG